MNIIATAKSIGGINAYLGEVNDASVIFVLYEPDEVISAAEMAAAYDTHAKLVFIQVESRDDKLLCIGGIKVRLECVTLDEELECPLGVLEKINGVFGNPARMPQKSPEFVASSQRNRQSQPSSIQEARRQSEKRVTMADVSKMTQTSSQSNSLNLSKKSQALYEVIGLTASDVGFTLGTDALMQAIASAVTGAVDANDMKKRICEMDGGQAIWREVSSKLADVQKVLGC